MLKRKYSIVGMHCSGCAIVLESLEDDLAGVHRARASYRRQQLEIEYNESLLDEADLFAAIRALGYDIRVS
ncbi:MAG: heavy-metal-associated domain-containing protein [Anaerolineae bacterium]|nr:heavy-metal-associated domain-containing protein [Anaerolineae bacterium]